MELGWFGVPRHLSSSALAAAPDGILTWTVTVLSVCFSLNLLLAVLNLIPFPPLDGAGALALVLPVSIARGYRTMLRTTPYLPLLGLYFAWQVIRPDALYQSVSQTGLALRNNRPRIFVLAAAGGGGSGLIVDLGYALRRLLHQLKYPEGEVILMLFCGAPDDPATPRQEQANVYATLTELNHFADPGVTFTAQYGPDGPRTSANCPPSASRTAW